jgi:hypothetical protein
MNFDATAKRLNRIQEIRTATGKLRKGGEHDAAFCKCLACAMHSLLLEIDLAELECDAEIMRKDRTIIAMNEEYRTLRDSHDVEIKALMVERDDFHARYKESLENNLRFRNSSASKIAELEEELKSSAVAMNEENDRHIKYIGELLAACKLAVQDMAIGTEDYLSVKAVIKKAEGGL